MEIYSRHDEDWQSYLQRRAIAEDISEAIEQIRQEVASAASDQTTATDGLADLERISEGIAGLQSAFDIAMGKAIWKLQMQQNALEEILAKVRPPQFEQEAQVYRERAEEAYMNGWYEEALADFLEAEKWNYRDFSVHRAIGDIYLYAIYDYAKALESYENCAKYAGAYSKPHAAEALMLASWSCYLQRDDSAAIANAQKAFRMHPDLTEAYYLHAKFSAASGKPQLAIPSLEQAVWEDPNYWEKVENDRDFEPIRSDLSSVEDRLRDRAKAEAEQILEQDKTFDEFDVEPCPETQPLLDQLHEAADLLNRATTYFDYRTLIQKLKQCREMFDALKGYSHTAPLEGHDGWIRAVAFSPDGKILASASQDRTIRLWDVGTRTQLADLEGDTYDVTSIAFSPDGSLLAAGTGAQTIRLWDMETKAQIAELKGHENWVQSVVFSQDERLLASGSEDGTIRLWNVANHAEIAQLKEEREGNLKFWDRDAVFSIALNPDASLLASGAGDKVVRLWGVASRRQIAQLEGHTSWVTAVCFSPDGNLLASASRDKTILLWDMATRKQVASLEGHTNWVHTIAFSPDGKLLASGSEDQTIRLWDVATKTEVAMLEGHTGWVPVVSFSPDSRLLASGSGDQIIRLWGINLVTSKTEKAEAEKVEQERLQREEEDRCRAEEERLQRESQKAIADVRRLLQQASGMGREKYAPAELQSATGLLNQAQAVFDQGHFEDAKSLGDQARAAVDQARKVTENRISAERRRNGQCVVCGTKLGFFGKRGGNDKCKAHR